MTDPSLDTTQLHGWLNRIRAGDRSAREELVRAIGRRLERMAHKMLRTFPSVQRWEQTDDVLQNTLVRLMRALETVEPDSVRAFFGLAALHLRRALLDLAKHYSGPHGLGAHHASWPGGGSGGEGAAPLDPPDAQADPADLERWSAFHEAVEQLPEEEREVVDLIFYQGWTRKESAACLEVSEYIVRQRWRSACVHLYKALSGQLPDLGGNG